MYCKYIICFIILLISSFSLNSQTKNVKNIDNEHLNVLKSFIKFRMIKDVESESKIIHPKTIEATKKFVFGEIKKFQTIKAENDFLKSMGYKSMSELENDTDINIYVKFNQSINKKSPPITEEVKKTFLDTLRIKVIMEGIEGDDLKHFLYRRYYETKKLKFQDLQLNSLRKHDGKWKISLIENIKRISPKDNKEDDKKSKAKINLKDL